MNTTMLIKMDKGLKTKAQSLAKEMGLPLGTLVNNYLKTFVTDRQVTFTAPMPNKETIKAIKETRAGKNMVGPFNTVKEAITFLKK